MILAEAIELMEFHTPSESLRRHMRGVAACLASYAEKFGEDKELWQVVGVLHDFDYELHPDEHPLWGMAHLESLGVDPVVIRAVASHYPEKTGVIPTSLLERCLFACDELSGFVTAVTYVRPSRSIHEVEVKSVLKKLKTPAFAAGVNRDDVTRGSELLGEPLENHIEFVIQALRGRAEELGLAGNQ
ncbi:MAG: HD domain-containing protein [Fimbriimonadaceae bacterium]|jgi:putative nucleotidyltransferase with HDIG domain|nr:HD domain-containing protein [Fimbriimonadaceae bacterium]